MTTAAAVVGTAVQKFPDLAQMVLLFATVIIIGLIGLITIGLLWMIRFLFRKLMQSIPAMLIGQWMTNRVSFSDWGQEQWTVKYFMLIFVIR